MIAENNMLLAIEHRSSEYKCCDLTTAHALDPPPPCCFQIVAAVAEDFVTGRHRGWTAQASSVYTHSNSNNGEGTDPKWTVDGVYGNYRKYW